MGDFNEGGTTMDNGVEIWVPHRISGFFQMQDPAKAAEYDSPLKVGSRGGGPSLTAYGKTKIVLSPPKSHTTRSEPSIHTNQDQIGGEIPALICINGEEATSRAKTSQTVVEQMAPLFKDHFSKHSKVVLRIYHQFALPMGAGYGSSGAGALGIAYGLNRLFNLGLSDLQAAKFAHVAEVVNHTGLGTVAGQYAGGLSIVTEPGYPFTSTAIHIPKDIEIAVASWGPIATSAVLVDPEYKELIFAKGQEAMAQMQKDWSLANYMAVCHRFLGATEMLHRFGLPKIESLLIELNRVTELGAGLNQLGQSVFCYCHPNEKSQVSQLMTKANPKFGPIFLKVADQRYLAAH